MKSIIIIILILIFPCFLHAQENDHIALFEEGEYREALQIIRERLNDIYINRSHDRRVPTEFEMFREADREIDLMQLFRERKAEHHFIEDNPEIHELHTYAARSYFEIAEYRNSLNHYSQALRFKEIKHSEDDSIAYEIAVVYKESGNFNSYIAMLETAYSLNPSVLEYSLELALALYPSSDKRKAIYHLERYISTTSDEFDPQLFLMLANMNEDRGKYLETEKYYKKYLEENPDDPYINFALGYTAFSNTANFSLAEENFRSSLNLLPEDDIFRRSKAHEYIADISYRNLKFEEAYNHYSETLEYQNTVQNQIDLIKERIDELREAINERKAALMRDQNFQDYDALENLKDELGEEELNLRKIEHEFRKLNAGRVRWHLAECSLRLERPEDAINFFREAIRFDYRPNDARDNITKIQLQIQRGY